MLAPFPGAEPIVATVVPVGVKPQPGSVSVSFVFKNLSDADRERLDSSCSIRPPHNSRSDRGWHVGRGWWK